MAWAIAVPDLAVMLHGDLDAGHKALPHNESGPRH